MSEGAVTYLWGAVTQVVVLSEGMQLFAGAPSAAVPWFADALCYPFEPAADGAAPDWLMDLVSVGFAKPNGYARRRARAAASPACQRSAGLDL